MIKSEKNGKTITPNELFYATSMQEQFYTITNKSHFTIGGLIIFSFIGIAFQLQTLAIFSTVNTQNDTFWKFPVILSGIGILVISFANFLFIYLRKYYCFHDFSYKNETIKKLLKHRFINTIFFYDNEFKSELKNVLLYAKITHEEILFFQPVLFGQILPRNPLFSIALSDIEQITLTDTRKFDNHFIEISQLKKISIHKTKLLELI